MAEITSYRKKQVLIRDNFTCQYCGIQGERIDYINHKGKLITTGKIRQFNNPIKNQLEIDHVIPRSKGGANQLHNLKTSCWECNNKKGDKNNAVV